MQTHPRIRGRCKICYRYCFYFIFKIQIEFTLWNRFAFPFTDPSRTNLTLYKSGTTAHAENLQRNCSYHLAYPANQGRNFTRSRFTAQRTEFEPFELKEINVHFHLKCPNMEKYQRAVLKVCIYTKNRTSSSRVCSTREVGWSRIRNSATLRELSNIYKILVVVFLKKLIALLTRWCTFLFIYKSKFYHSVDTLAIYNIHVLTQTNILSYILQK